MSNKFAIMEALLLHSSVIDKKEWDDFIFHSPQGSVFTLSWFLDIVAPDWNALVVREDGRWQGVMPLHIRKKYFIRYAFQPLLAKYWGVLLAERKFGNVYDEFHWKKKIIGTVIKNIPASISAFNFNFSPNFDYPLPFYWNGYKISTRFTYTINLNRTIRDIESDFKKNVIYRLQAPPKNEFMIYPDDDFQSSVKLLRLNRKHGKEILSAGPNAEGNLEKLISAATGMKTVRSFSARSKSDDLMGNCILLDFRDTVYYFLGLVNPEYKNSGIMVRLVYEVLKSSPPEAVLFDFTGSMMEGIESFFRSFGARPVPYYEITKTKFPLSLFID